MITTLFLTDIDGTLLKTNHPISEEILAAAHQYTDSGGRLSVCTGRHPISIRTIAEELQLSAPAIVLSGSMIYDFAVGKPLWMNSMPSHWRSVAENVLSKFPSLACMAYGAEKVFVFRSTERLRKTGVREECLGEEQPISQCTGEVFKLVLTGDTDELIQARDTLIPSEHYEVVFSSQHYMEITNRGVNKGAAVKKLMQMLCIERKNLIAAGDAMSDVSLLKEAGLSFAVESSPKSLLDIADYTIKGPQENGMAYAFYMAMKKEEG